jgi:PAS domain-containing protein
MNLNQPALLMFSSAMVSLALFLVAHRRRSSHAIFPLALLMLSLSLWSLLYGFELTISSLSLMKRLAPFQYIAIASAPVFWFFFALSYAGYDSKLKTPHIAAFFIVPLFSVLMVATNDLHHLYYHSAELGCTTRGFTYQKLQPAEFFWLHTSYSYSLMLGGVLILLRLLFRVSRAQRRQIYFFLAASSLPFIISIAYVSGFKPYGFLDTTPIAFIITAAILLLGNIKAEIFDITPVALDLLFSHIPDAIFVLDKESRIINTNPAAAKLMTTQDSAAENKIITGKTFLPKEDHREIACQGKIYDMSQTPIQTADKKTMGTLVVLRDITERKQKYDELQSAMEQIKTLRGIVPICASCKKIRDDGGYWEQVENYIATHSEARFTHGICPDCMQKLYPDIADEALEKGKQQKK